MELSEIKQFTHKITRVNLKNENFHSIYNYITQKITLTDVSEEDTIRFSLEQNSDFIQHQSFDNDYYIIIPNNLNSITYIYVHYFPAELYEYEEDTNIAFEFNFQQLLEENLVKDEDKTYGVNDINYLYPIVEKINGYTMEAGPTDKSIIVRSVLPGSIDGFKNPNYKDIIKTNINDNKDMTEQGYLPLSSRYRSPYQYFNEAPILMENPKWNAQEIYDTICTQNPYWHVRINRDGLSRELAETIDGEYAPISLNLNYQYLPTSNRQHQHYYGFEGECPENYDIYIMEGTHINEVNENFGSNNNYRIIKRTNPYDDTYSMRIDHECILPLELLTCTPKDYITKNRCYDYYIYTAIGNETPSIVKNLTEGEQYSLRYFIFVPSKVDTLVEEYNNNRPKEQIKETELIPFTSDMTIYGIRKNVIIEDGIFKNTQNSYDGFIDYRLSNEGLWEFEFEMSIRITGTPWGQSQGVWFKDADVNTNKYVEVDCYTGFRIFDNGEIYGQNANGENVFLTTLNLPSGDETYVHQITITKIDDTHLHIKAYTINSDRYSEVTFELPHLPSIEAFHVGLRNVGNHVDAFQKDVSIQNFKKTSYVYEYSTDMISSDCYLSVNGERIPDEFLTYDRANRNRWIYHEVPFIFQGQDKIEIVGPKNNPDIQFYLTGVEIEKFIPYSPELTYSKAGLTISENLKWDDLCQENKYTSGQINRIPTYDEENWQILPAQNLWQRKNTLPNPNGKVFITLSDDIEIDYDESSTNLYYSHLTTSDYALELKSNYDLMQSNVDNIHLDYDENTGDLWGTYPRNVLFFKGPNNSFYLYLNDENDNPITTGTVEVEFVKEATLSSEQLIYAGKKVLRQDGTVYFNKIDLSDIDVINEQPTKYYLRIRYDDPCFDEDPTYDFKIVYVGLPTLHIIPHINGNYKNRRFIGYDNSGKPIYGDDCNQYRQSKHFEDDFDNSITREYSQLAQTSSIRSNNGTLIYEGKWNHYDIMDKTPFKNLPNKIRGGYYVYDIEAEFPLKISLDIYNTTEQQTGRKGAPKGGWVELSVDDKVIQTTIVDESGLVDFYLNIDDVPLNKHTIKMEYYDKYWETIRYIYFDLIICDIPKIVRPSVPIIFKKFPYCPGYVKTEDYLNENNDTKCEFFYLNDDNLELYIPQDDTLLLSIDNKDYTNYNISLYRHKTGYKNINNFTDENSVKISSINITNNLEILPFFSIGLEYDTECTIESNHIENLHPTNVSGQETAQIDNLKKIIIQHGKYPYTNIRNQLSNTIKQIGNVIISPETLGDTMLYAPITYGRTLEGYANNYLNNFYLINNKTDNNVYYSLVTDNISGNKYKPFKRTFKVHYMNYIPVSNYEITWSGKTTNGGGLYSLNEEGYWQIKPIQIRRKYTGKTVQNEIGFFDGKDIIKEGLIEVYLNGEMYTYVIFENQTCEFIDIKKKTDDDIIKLRYVFKDGYHYVTS